jgi:AraC-like DNA-binding protein
MNDQVWSKAVQGVVSAAQKVGLNVDDLLSKVNLDASILLQIDARISHQQLCALWQEILDQTGEEAIGLRLAVCAQPATYDVLDYALDCSPNLGEALSRLGRYIRLIHESSTVTLETDGTVARLTHAVVGVYPPLPTVGYQWVMAHLVRKIRRMTGLAFVPLKVEFQQPQPASSSAYRQFFQAPVYFAQPTNELCFDAKLLQQPLLQSNQGLFTVLDRYATELLAKLPQSSSIANQIQRELLLRLQGGDLRLEAIAQTLKLSPRTLQRRLRETGTSYQVLLDETRRELAIYYLQKQQVGAYELTFLLGFSETSAFHRAFKRWTGKTAAEFRRMHRTNNLQTMPSLVR